MAISFFDPQLPSSGLGELLRSKSWWGPKWDANYHLWSINYPLNILILHQWINYPLIIHHMIRQLSSIVHHYCCLNPHFCSISVQDVPSTSEDHPRLRWVHLVKAQRPAAGGGCWLLGWKRLRTIYIYILYIHTCMHACMPAYLPTYLHTYIHTCLTKKGHQSSLSPNYVVPFSRNRQASPDASPEFRAPYFQILEFQPSALQAMFITRFFPSWNGDANWGRDLLRSVNWHGYGQPTMNVDRASHAFSVWMQV